MPIVGPIVGAARVKTAPVRQPVHRLVGVFGGLFLVAGLIDVGLALLPSGLGTGPQRFAAAAAVTSGWPILALGLVALQAAAGLAGWAKVARLALGLHVLFALSLLGAMVVLVASRGSVLAAVGEPGAQAVTLGFFRGMTGAVTFLAVHLIGAREGLRWLKDKV